MDCLITVNWVSFVPVSETEFPQKQTWDAHHPEIPCARKWGDLVSGLIWESSVSGAGTHGSQK